MARPKSGTEGRAAGYAGDLSPKEAWDLLRRDPKAVLVACRSQAEGSVGGQPDLSSAGKKPVLVEWQSFVPGTAGVAPRMSANANFVRDVETAGVAKDATVIVICRSGGRSRSAAVAMTAAGWQTCYNLAGGFEGPHDGGQHRGTATGWKADGLPWTQE